MAGFKPRSSRYTRAGSYLGQVFRPTPSAGGDVTFRPCFVGKGNRLAMAKNSPIRRSAADAETLTFSLVPPHVAFLDHKAKNDKTVARLYQQDGTTVSSAKWNFRESVTGQGYDQVLINTADFDKNVTYVMDYQSVDRDVLDEIPFSDIRQVLLVGDFQDQPRYEEGVDFVIPGSVSDASPDSGNSHVDPVTAASITATKTGTGSVAFGASNDYSHNYTRFYRLTVTAIGAGPPKEVTFKLEVFNHSGGNAALPQVPLTSSCPDITFTVKEGETGTYNDTNRLLQEGIYLDYTFGATNFVGGDVFEWFGYGPGLIEAHSSYDSDNEQFASVESAVAATTNTSLATLGPGTTAEYSDDFVRSYKLKVLSKTGSAATGTITLTLAGISDNEYFILPNGVEKVFFEYKRTGGYVATTLTAAQVIDSSVTAVVTLDVSAAGADDDAATITAAQVGLDANWPAGTAELTAVAAGGGTGRVDLTQKNYGIRGNLSMVSSDAVNIAVVGMSGATAVTATIAWAGWYELPYTTGSLTVDESSSTSMVNVTLEKGITLTFVMPTFKGSTDKAWVVGDEWTFEARPPIRYYGAKDDRSYELEITAALTKTLAGTAACSTIEGGFSTWTATVANDGSGGILDNDVLTAGDGLGDNIMLVGRNMGNGFAAGVGGDPGTRHAASDKHTVSATSDDVIKWDIGQRVTETVDDTAIRHDVLGVITGTPNTYYIVLDNTPTSIIHVRNASTSADLAYSTVANSPYVVFATNPAVDIEVKYEYRGNEPDPEQVYYITATRLRATSEYDQPVLWRSSDTARDGLGPHNTQNDVLIASEIAGELDVAEWYTSQVRDRDEDGVHTTYDYKQAILATEETPEITDLCLLNKFDAIGAAMSSIERCNDMFNFPSKFRLGWFGMPVGSSVGDVNTPGTTVYTAKQTMQVTGNSPAHGSYILLGNTWATRTILLDDVTEVQVTVDGSFIAAAAACLQVSFTDIAETVLAKDLRNIFDTMEEFTDGEENTLGGNNVTYLHTVGTSIFRFFEDITTDNYSIDLEQINAMKQKQFVTRFVTKELASKLTGFVPPDPLSAITVIKGFIVQLLTNLVASGKIAPYGAEQNPPTIREINPGNDVQVFVDETIKTDYFYAFWYNLRYPVKRSSGLYGVDSDAIMKGLARVI